MDLLKHSGLRIGVAGLVLLAIAAVAFQKLNPNIPPLPTLPGNSPLAGQVQNVPINIITGSEGQQGAIVRGDWHNILRCNGQDTFPVYLLEEEGEDGSRLADDTTTRYWLYEYTGTEPPFLGRFYISAGEFNAVDEATREAYRQLLSRNGMITEMHQDRTYYLMSEVDLHVQCSRGLNLWCGGGQEDGVCANGNEWNSCTEFCQAQGFAEGMTELAEVNCSADYLDDMCCSCSGTATCVTATDCEDDGDPCTENLCLEGMCAFELIPNCQACAMDADCDDGNTCTNDSCIDAVCAFDAIPGCGGCDASCHDVNKDGWVSPQDLLLIANRIYNTPVLQDRCVGGSAYNIAFDINKDNCVKEDDAECIATDLLVNGSREDMCAMICQTDADCDDSDICTQDFCEEGACQHNFLDPPPPGCVLPECGNGTVENTEGCDDANTSDEDGCNASCAVEPGWRCEGSPSVCEVLIPTLPGATNALTISQQALPSTDTATEREQDITLLRFEAYAADTDLLLTSVAFRSAEAPSSLFNGQNYTLWVDTSGDGVVDQMLQDGVAGFQERVSFDDLAGGGYVLPSTEPVMFEVHCDVADSLSSNELQLAFDTSYTTFVRAEENANGVPLEGIAVDNACSFPQNSCDIAVFTRTSTRWQLLSHGNLFVTLSPTPVAPRFLLGGTLAEPILRLQLRADGEDVEVTGLRLALTTTQNQPVDRLELFRPGESVSFAVATTSGCSGISIPQGINLFCAHLFNRQLVVPEQESVEVIVRPRMKSDQSGGVSGVPVQLLLFSSATPSSALSSVTATGLISNNFLLTNDGDGVAEGELFIGTSFPAPDEPLLGPTSMSALSKIMKIENANPDPDGSSVPTGIATIARFTLSSAASTNTFNGSNVVAPQQIVFSVDATNVAMQTKDPTSNKSKFLLYELSDTSRTANCTALYSDGSPIQDVVIAGNFLVRCDASLLNLAIPSASGLRLGLMGTIVDPNISTSGAPSRLQISLTGFSDPNSSASNAHFSWQDKDTVSAQTFYWLDLDTTTIESTRYDG